MNEHSFAVLAYRDSPHLQACLFSLVKQSSSSSIYIATSTPSIYLEQMARRFGVPLFVTQKGQGIAHDWNFALAQAKTKYVTIAHQDDVYLPDFAESCLQSLRKKPDAMICFSDYTEILDDDDERETNLLLMVKRTILFFFMPLRKHISSIFWKKAFLSLGCPIAAPSVTYNMENLPDFQFSASFSINLDWDAWYRLACQKGSFVFVNKILLQHRIHEESATTLGLKATKRQVEDITMFRRFWPKFVVYLLAKIYAISYKSNQI